MPLEKLKLPVPDRAGWATLMDSWGAVLDRYEQLSEDDVGYWHREASLTASLVAAAWLSGGLGLAEFVVTLRFDPGGFKCVLHHRFNLLSL